MKIAGLQKQSLIDYPGKIAAIIFTPGCNFRCPFCHNFDLVLPESIAKQEFADFDELHDFFVQRKDFLNGVVITGGEPTLWNDLPQVLKKLKSLGYSVKLDTNGSNYFVLKKLVEDGLVDYVAMDIKTNVLHDNYHKAIGNVLTSDIFDNITNSINYLINHSSIDYEFRTTFVPGLVSKDDVFSIVNHIKGANKYCLQKFIPENANDVSLKNTTNYTTIEIEQIKKEIEKLNLVKNFVVR